jgi:hypothetical protein
MRGVADTCDVCGKVKGETNHWFGVRHHATLGTVVIISFNKIPEDEIGKFQLMCGAGCLLKRVDAMVVAL